MSSFSMVLLEQGVEMELPIEMSELITMLDGSVPKFTCGNYSYQLGTVSRAMLGSNWDLSVNLVYEGTNQVFEEPVGCIVLEKLDQYRVNFRIPPRAEQDFPGMSKFDWNGQYFGSFIYQMLNTLHNKDLIHLPGLLPQI